jgi:WD40 repeat protein
MGISMPFVLLVHERKISKLQTLFPFAVLYEEGSVGPISHLTFSSQGLLAIGCSGADIWDLSQGTVPDDSFTAFGGAYMAAIAFSPDGSRIAIGQKTGVALFDITTATKVREHHQNGEVRIIAWSPDGSRVASCSEYGQYQVWLAETGEIVKEHRFTLPPLFLLWMQDQRISTNPYMPASSMWQVQLWNAAQTEVEHLIDDGECLCDDYTCAAMSSNGTTLALGTTDGFVQLWQAASGTVPQRDSVLTFHMNTVQGLVWSPDGTRLASGAADGHVAVWSERGELLFHTGSRRSGSLGVRDVAWWQDLLAVADDTGRVALYHVPTHE